MKKILFLAVAAIIGCTAWAGEMNLQVENEIAILRTPAENGIKSLPLLPAEASYAAEMETETEEFLPGLAICRHMPQGDQQGRYYMVLSLLQNEAEVFPQAQLHLLVSDTMAISREDNLFIGAKFYQSETAGGDAIDAKVGLAFLQYDTIGDNVYAKYDVIGELRFEKHEPITFKYRGYITFISDATNKPYVPTHEKASMGIEDITAATHAVRKVLHNGQLLLEFTTPSDVHYLNVQGALLK